MIHYIINQERNNRPYAEIPLAGHVNKNNSCLGAKVPGSESSRKRKFHVTFAPGNESSKERKFQNVSSRERKFLGTKVPPMELSLPGAKVRGNESSVIQVDNFNTKYQQNLN